MVKSSFISIILTAFFSGQFVALGQGLHDLYAIDIIAFEKTRGSSDSMVAFYFCSLARNQLHRLKQGEAFEFGTPDQQLTKYFEVKELMAPIEDETAILRGLPPGELFHAQLAKIDYMMKDLSLAEKMVESLGYTNCRAYIRAQTVTNLEVVLNNLVKEDAQQIASVLQLPSLQKFLRLTDKQAEKIHTTIESTNRQFKKESAKLLSQLEANSNDRWEKILTELNVEQRKRAEKIIGKPVGWFRIPQRLPLRSQLRSDGDTDAFQWPYSRNDFTASKPINKYSTAEIESIIGWPQIDALIIPLMSERSLWPELQLDETQRKSLGDRKTYRSIFETTIQRDDDETNRLELLLSGSIEYPAICTENLLSHQMERFQQIEFQVRTGPEYDSTVGVLHPRVVESFEIDSDQQLKIEEIGDEFEVVQQRLLSEFNAFQKRFQIQLSVDLEGLLEKEQRNSYFLLINKLE